ncbi:MAG: WD40 repeat domain-containing protein, partial [Pyrinomonadaceae bacterium]
LLSLEAYRKDNENPEARTSLMRALTYSPNMSAYLHNQGKIGEIVFSENGSQLSVLGINGTATLWDTRKHQPIGNTPKPRLEIDAGSNTSTSRNCSLLSHDGRWLVSIDEQGSLFIQSVENPAQIRTIPHTKMTCSQTPFLSLSNDNKKLAWLTPIHGNADPDAQELTVWDADKPDRVKSVPRIAVVSIAFSPDNQILATTNVEDDIVLVRADNLKPIGKPLRGAFNQNVLTNRIGFNKDGSRLASIKSNGDLAVWDVRNQKELHSLKRQEVATGQLETGDTLPSGFALSHTGDELVAGFADGSVVFSNIDTDKQAAYPARDKVPVTAIAFSPDENSVITLGGKSGPILWQKKSTQSGASSSWQDQPSSDAGGPGQIELRSGRAAAVSRIAFSPDSNMVAGACDDGTIVLWDLKHELPSNPFAAKGIVNFIFKEMPARTEMLARTESDEVVRFDMNGGKEISKFSIKPDWTQPDGNPPQLSDAVFNKNGTILAVGYSDNKVVVWDLEASLQKFVISDAGGGESTEDKQDARIFMAIDGEGKNLALAGDVGTEAIQLWSIDDRRMHSLAGIKNQVVSLTFSPDGKTLASGDYAGVITLWDTVAKKQRGTLFDESVSPSSNIEFTSDSTRLVSLSEDGTLRLWDVRPNTAPRWLLKPSTHISDFVLSPDSQRVSIVGIGDDGSILFWDLENGQEQFVFPSSEVDALGAGSILTALVYPPDGKTLAAGRNNGTVSLIRVDADYWIQRVCPIANRNLTQPEWSSYKVFEDNEWRFGWRTWKKEDAIYKQFGQTCVLPDNRDPGGISTEQ